MQLFSIPYIEGLAASEAANQKIKPEGLANTINNKAEGGGKINIKTEEKYLDDNCKEMIQFFAFEKREIPRRKIIIGEKNSLTNKNAKFTDLSDKKVISTVTRAEYRNAAISIEVKSYAAYGIYQAPVFDKIQEIEYEGSHDIHNLLFHTLTLGTMLMKPFERQFAFGCKTKMISSQYIETNNSKFTGEYTLLQVDMVQKISIEGAGNFDNLQTDEKGMLNLKLDDDVLLSLPEHGPIKLKIACKTCTRDTFFGSSAGFSGYSNFEINISEERKLANRKKINNFFNAALTDLAFTRLASFDSLDHKITERRYKEMLDGKYGYNATIEGFFEYLQDDFDAKKSGKSLRAQRNLKLAAIDEKNRLEELARKRDEEVRAKQQGLLPNTTANRSAHIAAVANRLGLAGISRCMAAIINYGTMLAINPNIKGNGSEIQANYQVAEFYGATKNYLVRSFGNPGVIEAINDMAREHSEYFRDLVKYSGLSAFVAEVQTCYRYTLR